MATTEKFGIDNLKLLVAFGVNFGTQLSGDLADGKVTLSEGFQLLSTLMSGSDLLAKKQAILDEAKDLSVDEVSQLVASVNGAITNADVVATIQDALNILVSAKNIIERYSKSKTA